MTAILWLPPVIRALATALIVVSASALAETLGPFWGALIASLPVSAGPAYVFLAMQHDPGFVAASALSSCAANAATGLFLIVYGLLAVRLAPWRGLGIAVGVWLLASLAIRAVVWSAPWALILNLAVYGVGFALPGVEAGLVAAPGLRRGRFDLLVRAVAVAAFVSIVVAASATLGAAATGIAAVFPISLISLIVIVRPRIGGAGASMLAASALRAMLGFGIMLLVLHLLVRPLGIAGALIAALLTCLLWSGGLLWQRARWASAR